MSRYEWGRVLKRAGFTQEELVYPMLKTMSCYTLGPWEFLMKTQVGTIAFIVSRRNSKSALLQFFTITVPAVPGSERPHNRKVEPRIRMTIKAIADPSMVPELAGLEWATRLMEEPLK